VGTREIIYLVFVPKEVESANEGIEEIDGLIVKTYIVRYDEKKDF